MRPKWDDPPGPCGPGSTTFGNCNMIPVVSELLVHHALELVCYCCTAVAVVVSTLFALHA